MVLLKDKQVNIQSEQHNNRSRIHRTILCDKKTELQVSFSRVPKA